MSDNPEVHILRLFIREMMPHLPGADQRRANEILDSSDASDADRIIIARRFNDLVADIPGWQSRTWMTDAVVSRICHLEPHLVARNVRALVRQRFINGK